MALSTTDSASRGITTPNIPNNRDVTGSRDTSPGRRAAMRAKRIAARVSQERLRRAIKKTSSRMQFTGERPSKMLYLGVAMIALFKDLLDFAGIGSLPAIGTVVTICLTFLIWILLAVFDQSSANTKSNMKTTRGLVVILFGLVEAIGFGLNFLPIETAMVIVLYWLANRAYKQAQKEARNNGASANADEAVYAS
ncbi:MAG TPA: hypothetical protein VJH89_02910 [Patescibacteria group bacterium]|nr:hypothetical protein [Patescibacteria group bacterium]